MKLSNEPSSTDACVNQILREVRAGRIDQTKRLGIGSVASRLGMSPAHTRMAFDRLRVLGVVEQRPKSGTYLRKLTLQEFVEITQLRAVLEGFACALACEKLDETQLDHLDALALELDRDDPEHPDRDFDSVMNMDLRFHGKIARASGNHALVTIVDIQHFIGHYLEILPGLHLDHSVPGRVFHTDIVRALRACDATGAEQRMRDHILWHADRRRQRAF